jgi:hypothetical protein
MADGVGQAPGEAHYRRVAQASHNLVVFLGAEANTDEHEGSWDVDSGALPDDRNLANELAAKAGLEGAPARLAEVAQHARALRGEDAVSGWLSDLLRLRDDAEPGCVHRRLAELPRRFSEQGLTPRYQMIVTPNYDAALEKALIEAGEPFDVAVYVEQSGRFVHCPWEGLPRTIDAPNVYPPSHEPELGFPIVVDNSRLMRTVIVRISGAVDDASLGFNWPGNYVVTEDHYIDYLSGRPPEQAIPVQILSKLRRASYLFLGYTIADWRLRVFLHRLWGGARLGNQKYWAVARQPSQLEEDLWTEAGVALFRSSLCDYLGGLHDFIEAHADELRP